MALTGDISAPNGSKSSSSASPQKGRTFGEFIRAQTVLSLIIFCLLYKLTGKTHGYHKLTRRIVLVLFDTTFRTFTATCMNRMSVSSYKHNILYLREIHLGCLCRFQKRFHQILVGREPLSVQLNQMPQSPSSSSLSLNQVVGLVNEKRENQVGPWLLNQSVMTGN